jgi:SAM-dependent methyltransferase
MSNAYDAMPYPTAAEPRLHVENLRVRAVLNGYHAVPPETARVLEIGCSNGFNLAPMAEQYPNAFFLGLDYAATAIETGNACVRDAGLGNIELRCMDLRETAAMDAEREFGQFGYIIAHGVYSWVPEDVRAALWALARKVLAPQGILHVSYNALPGWYAAQATRDFAGFLHEKSGDRVQALEAAWGAFGVLGTYAESEHPFAMEAARIRNRPLNVLAHDEWNEFCEPFYLTQVVRRAQEEGFRYVAEAGLHLPSDLRKHAEVSRMVLDLSGGDPLLQLQLLDFTAMRRFHDTLFTHAGQAPAKRHIANTLLDCWARSDIRFVGTAENGARVYEHSGGVRITSGHPLLCALADALEAAAPGEILLGEFLADQYPGVGKKDPQVTLQFGQMIIRLMEGAVISTRLSETPVARTVAERPRVARFARLQMGREGRAANAYHLCRTVPEPWKRALFVLLDGTRDREQLVAELVASGVETGGAEDRAAFFAEQVPQAMEEFRQKAFLV